ncbi:MAG: 6-hydroxymethylpterin diphosphokinase MptE-like protein [Hyphomonas sp.]
MIAWSPRFPKWKYPLGYLRLIAARHRYFDRIGLKKDERGLRIGILQGDGRKLAALKDQGAGRRAFIIGNGPSLKQMDLVALKDEITIAANGAYKSFDKWGFTSDYLLFEDIEQTEIRGNEIRNVCGPTKIASIYNAHAIARPWRGLLFMNARLADERYWKDPGIQFSRDFSHAVYLGSTITYVALQLAYHLGCEKVYLIGVDMDYGPLCDMFPPGKLVVTSENLDLVRQAHFTPDYYQVGDVIGVPDTQLQTEAFNVAKAAFETAGRQVFNAGVGGKLDVFDRVDFTSLFPGKP